MDKPAFVYVTYIATTVEKLWDALTKPGARPNYWFGMRTDCDWRIGSTYTSTGLDGAIVASGEVLMFEPPRRLSYTFHPEDERVRHEPTTRVTYEIEAVGNNVRLTVTHDQFEPGSRLFEGVKAFWPKLLSSLKSLLETGEPLEVTSPSQAE